MNDRLNAACRRVDAFCARLNPGLAAIALVLGMILILTLSIRYPDEPPQAGPGGATSLQAQTTG